MPWRAGGADGREHRCRETASVSRVLEHRGSSSNGSGGSSSSLVKARSKGSKGGGSGDGYAGKFVWRIEAFTRLKDLLKKRKITGLCIKSRRFTVGGRDCRLIVYPRGGEPLPAPGIRA